MAKLSFLLGAATGYVLGARAGKQRYEQIKGGAAQLWQSKPVQSQVEQAKHTAKTKAAPAALDAVSSAASVAGDKMRQGAGKIKKDPERDVSSVAVAGNATGTFSEDDFDIGQPLPSPYHRTKFEAEQIVRTAAVPWRVYRPSIVLGDSRTGEMDKIDGPYYFFTLIKKLRHWLPGWFPLVGVELGYTNIVPVDYVADALDHLLQRGVQQVVVVHRILRGQFTLRVVPSQYGARRMRLSSLPLGLRGRASTKSTLFGHL